MTKLNERGLSAYRHYRRRCAKGETYFTASESIRRARGHMAMTDKVNRAPRATGNAIWSRLGGSDGATFSAYGESQMRWFEDPESKGLRFAGEVDEIANLGHSGWYLDSLDCGETVQGVVYLLPGKNGMTRALSGYRDPWNNGPVCLSLEIFESESDSFYDNSHLRDAAYSADGIAERFADETREHQDAWSAGQDARHAASESVEAGKTWVKDKRALGELIAARGQMCGETYDVLHAILSRGLSHSCDAWKAKREEFHEALETREYLSGSVLDSWREGYDSV